MLSIRSSSEKASASAHAIFGTPRSHRCNGPTGGQRRPLRHTAKEFARVSPAVGAPKPFEKTVLIFDSQTVFFCKCLTLMARLSEPTTKTLFAVAVGSRPKYRGKCLHRQSGLRATPLTPKNSTIKNRGQLLSFLFAVAPKCTMSL